ncbi:MAG: hypothetical protein MMC23_001421 [Stictis urceolatum]|nr:hypothetical protein [Stictis urceolata]
MFALLIPPRPLLGPPQMRTLSPTQSAYTFPSSPSFSHLSMFMLPEASLPPNTLAAIYIQLPGSPEFTFLGALGPEKQSATFRVNMSKGGSLGEKWGEGRIVGEVGGVAEVDMDADTSDGAVNGTSNGTQHQGEVTVGISIEPAEQLAPQLEALKAKQAQNEAREQSQGPGNQLALYNRNQGARPSTKVLAQRIIKNAFNFLASFEGGDGMVPLKSFEGWWRKFERRVEMDPGFLEREDGGG